MTIAIDASSPARFTGTPADNVDITSASFTPPAGSACIVCVSMNSEVGFAVLASVSDSQGGTWTERVLRNTTEGEDGHASIWTRNETLPNVSMTVSVRRTNDSGGTGDFDRINAKAYVVTGQHASFPYPTVGEGSSTANEINPIIFTSIFANSLAIICATDWNANGSPTSSDFTEDPFDHAGVLSGLAGFKALGAVGDQTANINAAGAGAAAWNWAALEVREAEVGIFHTIGAPNITKARLRVM